MRTLATAIPIRSRTACTLRQLRDGSSGRSHGSVVMLLGLICFSVGCCQPLMQPAGNCNLPCETTCAESRFSGRPWFETPAYGPRFGRLRSQLGAIRGKIAECRQDYRQWQRDREEQKQAPPWPRFHPVPTKNVFFPTDDTYLDAPVVYGQFVSESEDYHTLQTAEGAELTR